jgi:hypothetical protein
MRVGSVALALIADLAGLSVWASVERSHANNLLHEQQAASRALISEDRGPDEEEEQGSDGKTLPRPRR